MGLLGRQCPNELIEIGGFAEISVDGGISDERNLIKLGQQEQGFN